MIECSICCVSWCQSIDVLSLTCCKNIICNQCVKSLIVPLCPFCRSVIQEVQDDEIYKKGYSYHDTLSEHTISQITQTQNQTQDTNIQSIDDTHIVSRILRRKIKRIRKLRDREKNRQNNYDIRMQIQEELDLFYFDI